MVVVAYFFAHFLAVEAVAGGEVCYGAAASYGGAVAADGVGLGRLDLYHFREEPLVVLRGCEERRERRVRII